MDSPLWDVLIWGMIVVLVLLPPRWDPAVRLKEWLEGKDETD